LNQENRCKAGCDKIGNAVKPTNKPNGNERVMPTPANDRHGDDVVRGTSPSIHETVLNALPISVALHDEDGQLVMANSQAADFNELLHLSVTSLNSSTVADQKNDRIFDVIRKSIKIMDRKFLLSTAFDITNRKKIDNELARRAFFDDLTGLPNRALCQRTVEDMLQNKGKGARKGDRFALAFIDLDNFKNINDYYSHAVGDGLLVEIAKRVSKSIRTPDILARISGDEFALILHNIDDNTQLSVALTRIMDQLRRPFYIEDYEIFTSASIGVSIYPDHGDDYETLLRKADSAMYRAKNTQKGHVAIFNPGIGQDTSKRMELEQRLRAAIRDRQFCCAFQPKVDIYSQDVIGLEALIRWRDHNGNISAPGQFVGLAVELGLIDAMTELVLAECTRVIDRVDEAFGENASISINVAAKQACEFEFMKSFAAAIKDTGYPQRIIIEVTEDAFLATDQFQKLIVPMLREAGIRVSIDDFGTGYSSLSALADIVIDEVKIDRSFITDIHKRPRSQSVLKAIESLANALGISVVAEGVETREELDYLRSATKILYAQGYYFAKPFFIETKRPSLVSGIALRSTETTRPSPNARARPSTRIAASKNWRR
jgi:cyclic di-GMP phosphodiesterase Gmr